MATDKKTVENDAVAKGGYHVTEHLMSTSEVANLLATNVDVNNPSKSQGLSSQEVRFQRMFVYKPTDAKCMHLFPCGLPSFMRVLSGHVPTATAIPR
jgi:hypothetical protein